MKGNEPVYDPLNIIGNYENITKSTETSTPCDFYT